MGDIEYYKIRVKLEIVGGYGSGDSACRDYCRTTKARYVEILVFTHFVKFFIFEPDERNYKNKVLIDRITISVVLDVGGGNTTENVYESE